MWYVKLLKPLVETICKTDTERSLLFIDTLFDAIKKEHLDPNIIFVFLIQFYRFFYAFRSQDVSLNRLAKFSIGLIILSFKYSEENKTCTSFFIDLFKYPEIYESLGLDNQIIDREVAFLVGTRKHPDIVPLSQGPTLEEYEYNNTRLSKIVFTDFLKEMEYQTLIELDYNLRIDISEVFILLNYLLNNVNQQQPILAELLEFLLPYADENKEFNQLINQVKKALRQFPARNSWVEPNDGFFTVDLIGRRTINLSLVSELPLRRLAQEDPAIILICNLLGQYTPLNNWSKFCFFLCGPQRQHTKEVRGILREIKYGNFPTVASIIARLKDIKISSRADELHEVIRDIEAQLENDISNGLCP